MEPGGCLSCGRHAVGCAVDELTVSATSPDVQRDEVRGGPGGGVGQQQAGGGIATDVALALGCEPPGQSRGRAALGRGRVLPTRLRRGRGLGSPARETAPILLGRLSKPVRKAAEPAARGARSVPAACRECPMSWVQSVEVAGRIALLWMLLDRYRSFE